MKKIIVTLVILSISTILNAANSGTVLFSDNFNRASTTQQNDIDASTAGMGGSLGTLTYVERGDTLIGTDTFTNLLNDQLHMAYGPNATSMYIDHNFSDSQILTDKGLRIGLTIVSNDGTTTDHDRWCGFGIGNSAEEAANTLLDYNLDGDFGTTPPFYRFRGSLDRGAVAPGISDIHIGWAPQNGGVIQVFKNGSTVSGGENYNIDGIILNGNDRLELELYFDDMNAGTEVQAYILWNSEVVGFDTFFWDHTNENYIGITARQNNLGFTTDDLVIDTVFNDKATVVSPPDGDDDISPGAVLLDWNAGIGAPVVDHLVSVTVNMDGQGEPNFVGSEAMYSAVSAVGTTFTIEEGKLDFDQTVYWKVDEVYSDHTAKGTVWSFDTVKSLPAIEVQPESVIADIGTDTEFTCEFSSLSEPTKVEWFMTASPDDISLVEITPIYDSETKLYTSTLAMNSISVVDEGTYYCEITNAAINPGDDPVATAQADLGVKRMKAHWKLDSFDIVNGVYPDETGNYPADPNTDPAVGQIIPNSADPVDLGNALDLAVEGDAAADSGTWAPSGYTGQISFSAWVNANAIGAWQGIVSNRTAPNAEEGNVWLEITPSGTLQMAVPGSAFVTPEAIPTNEWLHIASTAGPEGAIVYINGEPAVENTTPISINALEVPVFVGCLNRVGDTLEMANPLNGQIDDVRVYNYALSHKEVIDLYYEMLETPVCLNPEDPMLRFDSNGDCKVDIIDFGYLAADWFNCNWYPVTECP